MQQADSIIGLVVGAEGIGANELSEAVSAMCIGRADRTHLVQHNADTGVRDLPRGFGTGQSTANDVDRCRF